MRVVRIAASASLPSRGPSYMCRYRATRALELYMDTIWRTIPHSLRISLPIDHRASLSPIQYCVKVF